MTGQLSDDSLVLQIGATADDAAQFVGAGRGWRVVQLPTLEAMHPFLTGNRSGTALVVCDAAELRIRPLLTMARDVAHDSPELSLGYLYGRGRDGLSRAARKFVAKPTSKSGVIRLFSMLGDHYPLAGARVSVIGSGALREHGDSIIQGASALDFLVGHSNGQDMGLGGRVLCARPASGAAAVDTLRVMPCFRGGACQRERSGKGAAFLGDLVGAARLVNLSCWGVTLHDRPFAPESSVGEALLARSGVAVMIAALRALNVEAAELLLMYYYGVMGTAFGHLVNLVNQFRLRSGADAEWICFGDPSEAIERSAESAEVTQAHDAFVVSSLPKGRSEACDLVMSVDPWRLPEQPVLIQQTRPDQLLPAAIDPRGMICVTVPPGWLEPEIRYRIVDRRTIDLATPAATTLLLDLNQLEAVVGGPDRAPMRESVRRARETLSRVRHGIENHAAFPLPIGLAFPDGWSRNMVAQIATTLLELIVPVLDLCETFSRNFGLMQAQLWAWAFHQVGSTVAAADCPYCGSTVDERIYQSRLHSLRKCIAYCDACGFVYGGDRSVAQFIQADEPVQAGASAIASVTVTNPYEYEVPVSGYFVFDMHEFQSSSVTRFEGGMAPPGGQKEIRAEVPIPEGAASGTYYLGATILVGAKLNSLQRPIQIGRILGLSAQR
jgi:hypothetical protein